MSQEGRNREDVVGFLEYCKEKGLMAGPTADARKAAVNQVLGILSDDEAADVAAIDLDAVMRRFQNRHGTRYTPESLKTYKARVKNSIYDFLRFRENPMDFRITPTTKRLLKKKKPENGAAFQEHTAGDSSGARINAIPLMTASTLPIQIRQDLTVLIHGLPFDLNEIEARKIANVVLALAGVSGNSSPPQGAVGA